VAYVRFVIARNDEDWGRRQGLFQAISDLEHERILLPHEQAEYDRIYEWFRKNLKKPTKFSRASKSRPKNVAISWFKDSAAEHIKMMRGILEILRAHGMAVETIQTERPGYVVYEDAHQIVAEPFSDTGA
jgi:hypothetical protein